jgi:hypothetical protein
VGGSTLASAVAGNGRRVLVLERDREFKDRGRGENMLPWGVAAARRLLGRAATAGAQVMRGVEVQSIVEQPDGWLVTLRSNGHVQSLTTRLVVGADGRFSSMRWWGSNSWPTPVEAAASADSLDDLFLRLEAADVMLGIDTAVMPTMAKTPTLAAGELDLLRTVEQVVRLGHVRHVTRDAIADADSAIIRA